LSWRYADQFHDFCVEFDLDMEALMAKRATSLIGKPVVSAATGQRLGTVADLLLDDAGVTVVGVVLRHGWLKSEDVLPASSLQSLGPDAVVSRTSELIGAKEWRERQQPPERPEGAADSGSRAVAPRS
jgi:sporulation protein YlmC with PRC-barrel domain